jgi:NADPH:quinone reductase-like Zn-dependent oxidoreductase
MRAVVLSSYTGADGLRVVELPQPRSPGPGEVTLAVAAASVSRYDVKVASGAFGVDADKLPRRLGSEAAGVITVAGPEARDAAGKQLRVGDAVLGSELVGAHAELLTVKASKLLIKPPRLSFEEAASLLQAGTTAWHALHAVGLEGSVRGSTLLVHGASGSVGQLVVQLAVLRGVTVIAVASSGRHGRLRELGAIPVAYGDDLLTDVRTVAPGGVDAVIDAVGTDEALDVSFEVAKDVSRVVSLVNFPAVRARGGIAIGWGDGAEPGTELRSAARQPIVQLASDGAISVPVAESYPLAEAMIAYRMVSTGHAGGRVVLTTELA